MMITKSPRSQNLVFKCLRAFGLIKLRSQKFSNNTTFVESNLSVQDITGMASFFYPDTKSVQDRMTTRVARIF
jgi:hypothetical protein